MRYFIRKTHSTEQIPFSGIFSSGTHFTDESTDAMRIKSLAQGHNILIFSGFKPSIAESRNIHPIHMTNMLNILFIRLTSDASVFAWLASFMLVLFDRPMVRNSTLTSNKNGRSRKDYARTKICRFSSAIMYLFYFVL